MLYIFWDRIPTNKGGEMIVEDKYEKYYTEEYVKRMVSRVTHDALMVLRDELWALCDSLTIEADVEKEEGDDDMFKYNRYRRKGVVKAIDELDEFIRSNHIDNPMSDDFELPEIDMPPDVTMTYSDYSPDGIPIDTTYSNGRTG